MILKFEGVLTFDANDTPYIDAEVDGCYTADGHEDMRHNVIWVLNYGPEGKAKPFADDARVYVAIADQRFDGDLFALQGLDGYSEWTPGMLAELFVAPHDLIEELRRYEGQSIKLWIADEPVNTLEDSN